MRHEGSAGCFAFEHAAMTPNEEFNLAALGRGQRGLDPESGGKEDQ